MAEMEIYISSQGLTREDYDSEGNSADGYILYVYK